MMLAVRNGFSNLLKILRRGRQKRLSIFNPLSREINILSQSIVLQPATHLLLGPLAEWNTHVTDRNKNKKDEELILLKVIK